MLPALSLPLACWRRVCGAALHAARRSALVCALAALACAAHAAESLIVTTTVDEDNGTSDPSQGAGTSLREAINFANSDGVSSAITFSATAFAAPRKTITLNGTTLPTLVSTSGTLAITAPAAGVEISGNNVSRVFYIDGCTVTLTGLTIRNGRANTDFGGAVYNSGGLLVMDSCTLTANSAGHGGAIFTNGFFQGGFPPNTILRNCTLSGNTARGDGGAVYTLAGPVRIDSCTITQNTADQDVNHSGTAGGVFSSVSNAITMVRNSIVAGNTTFGDPDDVSAGIQSLGYNLIGVGSSTFTATGDQVIGTGAPGLGTLAENGGRTKTYALLSNSPARDAGNTDLTADQRGISRPQGLADDKGAFEFNTNTNSESLVVTTTADEDNGTSDPSQGAGTSLREAIRFASAYGGSNTITFSATAFAAPRKTIALSTDLPFLTGTLTLAAPAAGVEISGNNTYRVFIVNEGADVTMRGITIRNGNAGGTGGGVNNSGTLLLDGCTFTGNIAAAGGGIYSSPTLAGVTLTLRNCTFSGNSTNGAGGAIYNRIGRVVIDSCTLAGNSAQGGAGGVVSWADSGIASTEVRNSIISANPGGDVSIVSGNGANSFQSNGSNLIGVGTGTGAFNQSGDITGNTDPGLGTLGDNGGPTQTRVLLPTSPARNTGNTTLTVDQRSISRPQQGVDDKGAFELALAESLVVTTTADEDDGTSDPAYGAGTSLREAINRANTDGGGSAITFSAAAFAAPRKTITVAQALPSLLSDFPLSITAPTAGVEISGNNSTSLFTNLGNTTLTGLTLRNGTTNFRGGAIQNIGTLLLDSCSLINNTAPAGGAISSQTDLFGTTLTLRNCTLTGNTATTAGGALYNFSGRTVIQSCTLAGNSGPAGAGSGVASVGQSNVQTEISNSIIAGNSNGDVDVFGGGTNSFQTGGYNLVGDGNASGIFSQSGDQVIGNAATGLGTLQENGGRTRTLAISTESPAFDAGSTTLPTDQRGVTRPQGAAADIGAYERSVLTIGPATLPNALVGQIYPTTNFTASGGNSFYAFYIASGYLPPGLVLTDAGRLSGTAGSAGVYDFTLGAVDSASTSGVRDYRITIAGTSAPLAGDAAAWFRAEGNSGSFGGGTATISGSVGFVAGRVGQAFSFNGGGGHVVLSPSLFPFPATGTSTVPFSFETWFATTGSGVILGQQDVAPFTATGAAVPAIYVGLDGRLRVECFWRGTASPQTNARIVNDGAFHHVAAVFNGTLLTAYLDGAAYAAIPFTQTAYSTGTYFYQLGTGLGANRPFTPGGYFHFTGLIDEAAIYRRALSAAEVQALYAAGGKGKSSVPHFAAITKSGNTFDLELRGWPALNFQLQHTETLSPADWADIGASLPTNAQGAANFSVLLPLPLDPSDFFRAIEVP